jgi:hypothetical protein
MGSELGLELSSTVHVTDEIDGDRRTEHHIDRNPRHVVSGREVPSTICGRMSRKYCNSRLNHLQFLIRPPLRFSP